MKAIVVMFDSLNRHFLPPYGNDWVKAPNFARLAERVATFDNAYIGSSPTIPTRRELHTGRYNFLHRNWGPLEPFDDSMPEILRRNGVYTHLVTDTHHYWDDGGMTYHERYNTSEFARGQEGDLWKAKVDAPREGLAALRAQDPINRVYMAREEDMPQSRTFANALTFLEANHAADNWLLHIETFDPHEPYFVPRKYVDLYPHEYNGPPFDWPEYGRVNVPPEQVHHARCLYAALLSMCDASLGRVLDFMDAHDLWRDTMLVVTTDHGFMLGEKGWFAKMRMPYYNEIAHIPLFVWDSRCGVRGERRRALTQTIDLAPTLLEFFGQRVPQDMQGKPLLFDLEQSPAQEKTLDDPAVERQMIDHLVRLMKENDAPSELYDRLGLQVRRAS